MTREIMINQLKDLKCHCEEMAKYDLLESPWRKDVEALEMAIKALEQEQKLTRMIDKSDFSQEQYSTDIQSAYDCGKSVLDKIREDINNLTVYYTTKDKRINLISQRAVNRVFDKYRK